MSKRNLTAAILLLIIAVALIGYRSFFSDQQVAKLDTRWEPSVETSEVSIDHSLWQSILDDYLISETDSGVNLFDYAGLLDDGREGLDQYVAELTGNDPLLLNRSEQKAYWINLYNAVTVAIVLDNYPLSSITDIKGAITSFGPWDNVVVDINNHSLSLNDIEHRIIRPLYNDYRIHFAVNCASLGCPDLSALAYTATNMETQLDKAASDYLNHPRGIRLQNDTLLLSSLFKWYLEDFGTTEAEMLRTLSTHTTSDLKTALAQFNGSPEYAYDWALNGYCSIDNECGDSISNEL